MARAELEMAAATGPADNDLQLLGARLLHEIVGQPAVIVDARELAEAAGRAWMMAARVALNTIRGRRTCRLCGCWEREACESSCGWAAADLCTACADPGELPGPDRSQLTLPGVVPPSPVACAMETLLAIRFASDGETARALADEAWDLLHAGDQVRA